MGSQILLLIPKNMINMGSTKMSSYLGSLFLIATLFYVVVAIDHRVGGDFGWNLPSTPTFFSQWASNNTFFVGDTIRFNSSANETHNFAMPESQSDFDGCVKSGISLDTVIFIVLDRPTRKYFICNVGNHCNLGMKFAIDVLPKPGMPFSPPPNVASIKLDALSTLLSTAIVTSLLFFI